MPYTYYPKKTSTGNKGGSQSLKEGICDFCGAKRVLTFLGKAKVCYICFSENSPNIKNKGVDPYRKEVISKENSVEFKSMSFKTYLEFLDQTGSTPPSIKFKRD